MAKKIKISSVKKNFFDSKYHVLDTNHKALPYLEDEELFNYLTLEIFRTFEFFNKNYQDTEKKIEEYFRKCDKKFNELFDSLDEKLNESFYKELNELLQKYDKRLKEFNGSLDKFNKIYQDIGKAIEEYFKECNKEYVELFVSLNNEYGNFFFSCGYDFEQIFSYIYSKFNFINFKLQTDNNINSINLLDDIKRKDPKVIEACINENDNEIFNLDRYLTITEIKNFIPRNYRFYDDVSFTARFFLSSNNIEKTIQILKEELDKKSYRSDYSRKMLELYTKRDKFIFMIFSYHMKKELTYIEMKALAISKLNIQKGICENFNNNTSIQNKFTIYQNKLNDFFNKIIKLINESENTDIYIPNKLYLLVQIKYIRLINELFSINTHYFNNDKTKELFINSELIIKSLNYSSSKMKQQIKDKSKLIQKLQNLKEKIILSLQIYVKKELKNTQLLISKMENIKIYTTLPKYTQDIKELKKMIELKAEYMSIYEKL